MAVKRARKSVGKPVKPSYAERVLGAVSRVQTQQKQRGVHVATTLRAEVRKHAQARKDELGPHWSTWVHRAVNGLKDQGLLEDGRAGTVSLTPKAKHAISSASHGLVADPEQGTDDLLWRAVTHSLSATPATPRRKRKVATESTVSPRVYTARELGLEDTDDELTDLEDDEDQPAPKKRARLTKSDMTRMRKAELIGALEDMQKDYAATGSKLKDSTADRSDASEIARLQALLKDREQNIARVQRELATAKRSLAPLPAPFGSDSPSRLFMTPAPSSPPPSSPTLRPQSRGRLAQPDVVRTFSGTLISQLSKQATPAPTESNPGSPRAPATDMDGPGPEFAFDVPSASRSSPQRTPSALSSVQDAAVKISALELTLDARVSELEQARANVTRLVSEEAELRAALATRDTELAALLAEMDNLRTDKVTQGALAEAQRVQIATLHATNAGLEASVAEHARAARDLDALVSAKSDDIARLSAAHADTMATLAALEERVQSLARSGAAAEAAAAEERAALEARLTDAVAGRDTLAAALSTADADKAALELARASLDSELAGTKQALAESEAEARQLAVSFSTTTASVEQLRAADADKETVLGEVRTTLAAVTAASVAQSNEVDRLRALVATSELSLDETCTRLHAARDALARRNADIVALEAEKQNLVCAVEHAAADQAQAREALATRDVKIASLADDLLASSGQLQDLRAVREVEQSKHCNALARAVDTAASRDRALEEERMAKAVADADLLAARVAETATRAELGEVRRALDAEKIVVADLQRNLATATACARDADDEIADLRAAKRSDEQTIDGLRRGYEDLRQAQLSAFSKLDSLASAQSSPMPKARRSSVLPATLSAV